MVNHRRAVSEAEDGVTKGSLRPLPGTLGEGVVGPAAGLQRA